MAGQRQGRRSDPDQYGTGNIIDLAEAGLRFPGSTTGPCDPDAFFAAGEDSGCGIVDAWYTDGPTTLNDPAIERFESVAYLGL